MGRVRRDTMYASMQKMTKGKELLMRRLKWAYSGATCYVEGVKVMDKGKLLGEEGKIWWEDIVEKTVGVNPSKGEFK